MLFLKLKMKQVNIKAYYILSLVTTLKEGWQLALATIFNYDLLSTKIVQLLGSEICFHFQKIFSI